MRRHLLYITAILSALGSQPSPGEERPAITLSPELKLQAPVVPAERNGIMVLKNRLSDQDFETDIAINRELENLRSGKAVEDRALIKQLQRRHGIARQALKAPVQCREEANSIGFLIISLFEAAELLSRDCSRRGDHKAATVYLKDMLEWSALIRNANPNSAEASIARSGWGLVFDCAFQEWESHPD